MKTSKSVSKDVSKEELKGMMQLVPLEEVYVKALQVKHPIIDWDIPFEGKREYWKIIRLGDHTARYQSLIIGAKDKGKEKVVESEVPKKRKLQEQMDAQVAREIEEEYARENQRLSEQLARDSEIARLHAEEELKIRIEGLDRSNEVIAKHLREYEQAETDLSVGEKLELISELVKYQDHHAKILKYQAQQSKPLSKKEQMEFYMSVLRSHAGWKTKHFKGMIPEQLKEKFVPVWKQLKILFLCIQKKKVKE
uniref:Uncharacterized protein n=1 Tax=Tanacetum cinerariifolium TaxID=118510 RepID=A0A699HPW4_TANCI|nr:hypothetical protein [Tanacetum cinerariifolium]